MALNSRGHKSDLKVENKFSFLAKDGPGQLICCDVVGNLNTSYAHADSVRIEKVIFG